MEFFGCFFTGFEAALSREGGSVLGYMLSLPESASLASKPLGVETGFWDTSMLSGVWLLPEFLLVEFDLNSSSRLVFLMSDMSADASS